jgi:predicted TIM-barrel fold metal-dependent hydrolase
MGRLPQPNPLDHPAFTIIRRMLDKGRTWVKLAGAYQDTNAGAPAYADKTAVAQAYIAAAPERVVWGSDWPHPTEKPEHKPDDAALFDLLAEWAPDEAQRRRILVTNPEVLYGFAKAT